MKEYTNIAKYSSTKNSTITFLNSKSKLLLSISTIFFLATTILKIFFSNCSFSLLFIILEIISTLLYFLIISYCIFNISRLHIYSQILEKLNLKYKALQDSHDAVRGFKHDFNNIIQSIGGYICCNDIEGLKLYYNQLLIECQIVNNIDILSSELIDNPAIYNLICSKYFKACNLGIKVDLNIFMSFKNVHVKIYELARILGILLDNAIEAAVDSDLKVIKLEFKKDIPNNRFLLIIKNSYSKKDLDIDSIFEKGVSSKPNNSGLGLWEVKKILNKVQNINLYTYKDATYFTQQVELYSKNKKE